MQARLERPDVARAYSVLRDAFADSVERHEAQHRLDAIRGLEMPSQVERLVRGSGALAANVRDGVKNELSAYVAQIARDDRLARTTFTLLVRFLVNPKTRSSTESYAAIVATEERAQELGATDVGSLVLRGRLDEDRLARAHRAITAVPPAKLADAVRHVWKRLFGRDLAALERVR